MATTSYQELLVTNFGLSPSGYTGSRGATGLGFVIAKSYASVAALTADTSPTGITAGQFAIIDTGNVDNAENSRLYLWTGSAYNYVNDLSGAAGITGPQGTTGYAGSAGGAGYAGSAGYTGSASTTVGYTGSVGTAGTNGYTGSVGNTGYAGSAGANGYTGSTGTTGYVGSAGTNGYTGSVGAAGTNGYTGSAGTNGYTGSVGFVGSGGTAGYTGSAGIGYAGSVGYTGSGGTGYTGSAGTVGYTGSAGGGGGSGGSSAVYSRTSVTATAGQTTFSIAYNVNYIEVYFNGALLNSVDYTASNGTTVVLTDAAAAGDIVEFVTYNMVSVANIAGLTLNSTSITSNIAITAGYSAVSVGPLNIATGVTVSIADGQKWVIL